MCSPWRSEVDSCDRVQLPTFVNYPSKLDQLSNADTAGVLLMLSHDAPCILSKVTAVCLRTSIARGTE